MDLGRDLFHGLLSTPAFLQIRRSQPEGDLPDPSGGVPDAASSPKRLSERFVHCVARDIAVTRVRQ
jgi:hypothetical protein